MFGGIWPFSRHIPGKTDKHGQRTEHVKTGHVKTDHFRRHFRGHFRGHPRGTFRGAFRGESSKGSNRETNVRGHSRGQPRGHSRGHFRGPTRGHTRGPTRGVKFRGSRALCFSQNKEVIFCRFGGGWVGVGIFVLKEAQMFMHQAL